MRGRKKDRMDGCQSNSVAGRAARGTWASIQPLRRFEAGFLGRARSRVNDIIVLFDDFVKTTTKGNSNDDRYRLENKRKKHSNAANPAAKRLVD